MIIEAILIPVDSSLESELVEFDTMKSIDINGVPFEGLGAIRYQLAVKHKEQPIAKCLVALDTPQSTYRKYSSDMIPKGIELSQTKNLEYNGGSRITDTSKKIRSLMNSDTPEDIVQTCIKIFSEITERMDVINAHFKSHKPHNAEKQGFIRHHFPSPEFKKSNKEMQDNK